MMVDNQGINERLGELDVTLERWAPYRDSVQAELKEIINRISPSLQNIIRYHMGWADERGHPYQGKSSKYLRSLLLLLSCEVVAGDTAKILPAAAAVEFVHNASLVHDDIQDGSYERHGRPTIWSLWGKSQAINIGDLMFGLASLVLIKLKDNGVSSERIVYCVRLLSEACAELCEGQYLDIEYENQVDVTAEDYLSMVRKKTAALMAASTSLGAYLGKGEKQVLYFHQFGEALGMAYQIRDDVLGIWGRKESTGKPVEDDIRLRRKTLPVVYALNESGHKVKLERLYSQRYIGGEDVPVVVEILNQSGARDYAQNLAEQYYRRALERLEASGVEKNRQAPLKELARFFLERNY